MINTPFNYTGSKFKLLEQIIPYFDFSKDTFVDLFTGGGSIYTNIIDKYNYVIANDIIENLIGIHKELVDSNDIIDKVKNTVVSKDDKEGFLELRDNYNENPEPYKLWALMLCSTNNMMRFNRKFKYNQTFGKRTYNPSTEKKIIEFVNHIRKYKSKLTFRSEHFIKIKPKDSMVYIDPPYSNTEAGYNAYWNKNDDLLLYDYIKKIDNNNSFMVSGVGEHGGKKSRLIDMLIGDGYNFKILKNDYQGVSRNKSKKQGDELIIFN